MGKLVLYSALLLVGLGISLGSANKIKIRANNFLRVEGKEFRYGNDKVFLSGTNAAWINYGYDFGNGQWDSTTNQLWKDELKKIGDAGANSVRVWIHVEGDNTPEFDNDGFVTAPDRDGTLVSDLRKLLDVCQQNGLFLNLVLWNGAMMRNQKFKNLFYDDAKLQRYIDNALVPMVNGLKDHPALGAWEVINEPEGSIPLGQTDSNQCFDTTHLDYTRAPGWTGGGIPIRNALKFVNWQAAAIHQNDPKALVSTGSWSEWPQTENNLIQDDPVHKFGFNHYKDECLLAAGGRSKGTMDFWQIHIYPYQGRWSSGAPWSGRKASDYGHDGPLVIGEYPTLAFEVNGGQFELPNGDSTEDLPEYLYNNGFAGAWNWCYGCDKDAVQDEDVLRGIRQLKGRTENGKVDVVIS